jgi:hypothetical protein
VTWRTCSCWCGCDSAAIQESEDKCPSCREDHDAKLALPDTNGITDQRDGAFDPDVDEWLKSYFGDGLPKIEDFLGED